MVGSLFHQSSTANDDEPEELTELLSLHPVVEAAIRRAAIKADVFLSINTSEKINNKHIIPQLSGKIKVYGAISQVNKL